MIFYFIIEDLSKHYLQKKLHMPESYKTPFFLNIFYDKFMTNFIMIMSNTILSIIINRRNKNAANP
ncbi:hypothetical protein D3Z56_00010 [Lachnospiraceae bacterium]|nr:hypothetical protein [Lachnospiraceae bacterium]